MMIKCNNKSCAYQYAGECTVREHVQMYRPEGNEPFHTHCTSFSSEYVHIEGELKELKQRNVFCFRDDCAYNEKSGIGGKCGRKKIELITGLFGDNECRCKSYERKVTND